MSVTYLLISRSQKPKRECLERERDNGAQKGLCVNVVYSTKLCFNSSKIIPSVPQKVSPRHDMLFRYENFESSLAPYIT